MRHWHVRGNLSTSWTEVQPTTPKLISRLDSLPLPSPPKQTQRAEVRFTSKADIEATQTDVRFVPIADIVMRLIKIRPPRRPPHMRFRSMQLRDVFGPAL
jgi:hypothetical protein